MKFLNDSSVLVGGFPWLFRLVHVHLVLPCLNLGRNSVICKWNIIYYLQGFHWPAKSGNWFSQKILLMVRKNDVHRPSCITVVYFYFKKWKHTFGACYNKMVMERSRCRGGGADYKLLKTSSCTSDGSGNNAEHSRGKSENFSSEIEWEPWFSMIM